MGLHAGERREAERFAAAMPVTVDGLEGTTQDLSTTGLSFRSAHPYEPGAHVEVVVEYLLDGHHYPLRCRAEVLRSEADGDGWRVAARLVPQSRIASPSGGEEPAHRRAHLRRVA
jgi:hypothetical protein